MMKYKIISSLLILLPIFSIAQENKIIINKTEIITPPAYNFDTITDITYVNYIIKNNRSTPITIKNVNSPNGIIVNITPKEIAAGKKANLYIAVAPIFTDFKGEFDKKILIHTNLIKPIEIEIKGYIPKQETKE